MNKQTVKSKKKNVADITVGYQCNCNCLFCSVGDKRKELIKTTEDIELDILEAKKLGVDVLGLGGGEPTIRKDIFEIVNFAKKQGFPTIRIQTNGQMFAYDWFVDKIIEAGANFFRFSIHGHNAKLHDKQTRVPGSFDRAIKGINNLKKRGFSVEVDIVINKVNYKFLPQFIEYLLSLGVFKFGFIYQTYVGNVNKNIDKLAIRISEVTPYLKEALEIAKNYNVDKNVIINIPFCLIEKYKKDTVEEAGFNTVIFNPEKTIDLDLNRFEDKIKTKGCKKCKYNNQCCGVWNDYAAIFGLGEIKPITN
ncbi:MAG: radical SAM protein [Nanoarchaeota archaeon]|nr:radical SAM protein [Nanoarchaeota archaeon]